LYGQVPPEAGGKKREGETMKSLVLAVVAGTALAAVPVGVASADPTHSRNTLTLQETCANGMSYTLVTPASGKAVLDLNGTGVQLTRKLDVYDPLDELGGSFSVPLQHGFTLSELTMCTGSVVGTSVSFTAYVQTTPAH
jgi:hypothetical protein